MTRYWTAAEKNARFIPFAGALLANRGIWIAAALGILAIAYRGFSFRARAAAVPARERSASPRQEPRRESRAWSDLPSIRPAGSSWLATYRSRARLELRALLTKSTLLLLLLWLGWAVSEIHGDVFTGEYGSTSYPATSLILAALRTPATILGTILILYYGAELFWREQRSRMAAIVDSTPVSGSAMIAAKWTALAALLGSMLLGGAAAGVALQAANGYFHFQPLLYLSFFYFAGMPLLLYAAASLFIHALSPGKYAGMIFFVLFLIVSRRAADLGLEHDLWRFATAPSGPYSELNGFGHYAAPFHGFMLHWTVLALLLATMAAALWRRIAAPPRERLRQLARPGLTACTLAAVFVITGCWIFYNTNIAHAYVTADEMSGWQADYEKTYKRIETMPRPRLLAVDGEVDLYPAEQRYRVAGRYTLVNDSTRPIASLYVAARREARLTALSIPSARQAVKDDRFGMHRFDFQPPLAPDARAELRFDLSFQAGGFASGQQDDAVVENGTFLMNLRGFPTLGYRASYELSDPRERRKRGLGGESAATLEEDGARGAVETSVDEWIDLDLTVSTAGDQIAVAPGRLRALLAAGRAALVPLSHRRADPQSFRRHLGPLRGGETAAGPGRHRALLSPGSCRERRAHARHRGGIARRDAEPFRAVPSSPVEDRRDPLLLADGGLCSSRDGLPPRGPGLPHRCPRPGPARSHRAARGPRGGPSMVRPSRPHRQRGGGVDDRRVAGQVFGAAGRRTHARAGAGPATAGDRARPISLRARGGDVRRGAALQGRQSAVPLLQQGGGRALRHPRSPRARGHGPGPPRDDAGARPTSADLVRHLRAAGDAGQGALIDQWTREIVLYDLRVDTARTRRRADGRYDVTVRVAAGKSRAEGRGNEQPIAFDEPVEIAVASDTRVLDSRRHALRRGMNEITLIVDSRPSSVTVDPWITRIDRNPADNVKRF